MTLGKNQKGNKEYFVDAENVPLGYFVYAESKDVAKELFLAEMRRKGIKVKNVTVEQNG